jgi:hypothetical protein
VDTVLTSISSLPRLKSFSVKFIDLTTVRPAISQLKNLQKLAIQVSGYSERTGVFQRYVSDQVHIIICNSPGLTRLDLAEHDTFGRDAPSLYDLFGKFSETGAPPLKL